MSWKLAQFVGAVNSGMEAEQCQSH